MILQDLLHKVQRLEPCTSQGYVINVGVEAHVPKLREVRKKLGLEEKSERQILHLLCVEKYVVEKETNHG